MEEKGDSKLRPGPRDHLITRRLRARLAGVDDELQIVEYLDPAEAPERLARHAMEELRRGLDSGEGSDEQAARVNQVIRQVGSDDSPESELEIPARLLQGIKERAPAGGVADLPPLPSTPFSQSDLLVNAEGQPNIGSELKAELASADRVDLICAFVIWSGVRQLRDALKATVERGGKVRVITTTYMGATEKRAVDELVAIGAEVRVALDARTTKLHAKAWLLERESGLNTAFVGSSNLSHTALFDGLEWNVRLSSVDASHVIDRVRMTFESHWESEHFEHYDPAVNGDDLAKALSEHDRRSLGESSTITFANLEVRPYPHQQRMLEALAVERDRHDRHRNLVVAATGTGKTVVAALDYRELFERLGDRPSILFVAHRDEILRQSLATYRAVVRDGSFGEILASGSVVEGKHVFAMVQSLNEVRLNQIGPEVFDVVVIDEFHHAKAKSYDRLLDHLKPKELLGLTATPERLDGQDVTIWFDHRIAVELRLWEAIDQGFLVPFQYYGVADGIDLAGVTWNRGGYATGELSNLYSGNDLRVAKVLEAIQKDILDPSSMKALGFCVSKEHAHFMARKFTEAGLHSVALTGDDAPAERQLALAQLARGDLRCVFSVEVLGEGVDVPDVDCILLLRPTSSPTLFAQQLGRGLRKASGKSHLTVIDLIGQHRREFRFDDRLSAIVDRRRGKIVDQVEAGFPFLPAGCSIELDQQSERDVLRNLREASRSSRWAKLVSDLRSAGEDVDLQTFLDTYEHEVADVYRSKRSWTELKREAFPNADQSSGSEIEVSSLRNLSRMTHIDDQERLTLYRDVIAGPNSPVQTDFSVRQQRMLTMLAWSLGSGRSGMDDLDTFFEAVWEEDSLRDEMRDLLAVLDARSNTRLTPVVMADEIPLHPHARYSREEIVAALGFGEGVKAKVTQGGVLWVTEAQSNAFFIDLHKAERDYSPTTMYRDYAINRDLFHWESQSRQAPHQPTVQRYIDHRREGTEVLLFVRQSKRWELGTQPFTFLGPVDYVSHEGERPVKFTWKLRTPMPAELFESARSVAVA